MSSLNQLAKLVAEEMPPLSVAAADCEPAMSPFAGSKRSQQMFLPELSLHCEPSLKPPPLKTGFLSSPRIGCRLLQYCPKPFAGWRSKSGWPPGLVRSLKSRTIPVRVIFSGGSASGAAGVPDESGASASGAAQTTSKSRPGFGLRNNMLPFRFG